MKEVNLSGLKTKVNKGISNDGECGTLFNLRIKDNIVEVISPTLTYKFSSDKYYIKVWGYTINNTTYYIGYDGAELRCNINTLSYSVVSLNNIVDVIGLGNIITIITTEGLHYCLIKDNKVGYIGAKKDIQDFCTIDVRGKNFRILSDTISEEEIDDNCLKETDEEGIQETDTYYYKYNKTTLTEYVRKRLESLTEENKTKQLSFSGNRLFTAAIRLFDGTYIYHTDFVNVNIPPYSLDVDTYFYPILKSSYTDYPTDKYIENPDLYPEYPLLTRKYRKTANRHKFVLLASDTDFSNIETDGDARVKTSLATFLSAGAGRYATLARRDVQRPIPINSTLPASSYNQKQIVKILVSKIIYELGIGIKINDKIKDWKDIIKGIDIFCSLDYTQFKSMELGDNLEQISSLGDTDTENEDNSFSSSFFNRIDLYKLDKDTLKSNIESISNLYKIYSYNLDEDREVRQETSIIPEGCTIDDINPETGLIIRDNTETNTSTKSVTGDIIRPDGDTTTTEDDSETDILINEGNEQEGTIYVHNKGTQEESKNYWEFPEGYEIITKEDFTFNTTQDIPLLEKLEEKTENLDFIGSPFLYNKRLHLYNLSQIRHLQDVGNTFLYMVEMQTDSGLINVPMNLKVEGGCLFVPNSNCKSVICYKIIIKYNETDFKVKKFYKCTLNSHPFFNFSYCVITDRTDYENQETELISISLDSKEKINNIIRVSNVSNPLQYEFDGTYKVSNKSVIGLGATTEPVSEGQFGQYPLYAFTQEGIFGMTLNTEGLYTNITAIADNIIEPNSILSIKGGVFYLTSYGAYIIYGRQSVEISEDIREPKDNIKLYKLTSSLNLQDFRTFIQDTTNLRLAYNYTEEEIIIYNTNYDFQYIFNIKQKNWYTTTLYDGSTFIPLYPDTLCKNEDKFFSLQQNTSTDTKNYCELITRPLKLDTDDLKNVLKFKVQSILEGSEIQSILYSSLDNINYYPISGVTTYETKTKDINHGLIIKGKGRYYIYRFTGMLKNKGIIKNLNFILNKQFKDNLK